MAPRSQSPNTRSIILKDAEFAVNPIKSKSGSPATERTGYRVIDLFILLLEVSIMVVGQKPTCSACICCICLKVVVREMTLKSQACEPACEQALITPLKMFAHGFNSFQTSLFLARVVGQPP